MLSFRNFTGATAASSSCHFPVVRSLFCHRTLAISTGPRPSLRLEELSLEEPLQCRAAIREVFTFMESDKTETVPGEGEGEEQPEVEEDEDDDEKGIPKIGVARQTYIPVSKSELLEAIVSKLFDSPDDANQFLLLSSRLDSILHAEHKSILEEMRRDYFVSYSADNEDGSDKGRGNSDGSSQLNGDKSFVNDSINGTGKIWNNWKDGEFDMPLNFGSGLDLKNILGYSAKIEKRSTNDESRLAVATRFQRAFMQLLNNAQFQELSARDLMLTSALNSDYLLTLPVYVDWKKASESNAIIFRPIFLSRISLSDIWRPATRKYCGNNPWKMLKTSFSILLSQSVLQEPAFEELILLYTNEVTKSDKAEVPPLQLKIYQRIPIPDLPVVFPHKKLSFRIIDTVRLDLATILGLSAYFINYKFENIGSSPSAIYLDVIAITALIIYVTRVALGYKQTWDRYQLLVNRTLYEKTLASGFGSVHFLLDASEQQQYKEAILTYAILLKAKNDQVSCHRSISDECERFIYDTFNAKVEMPIIKAVNTLVRLGLVIETPVDGRIRLEAIPCEKADEALKARWNNLLG
ncbi:uncharacterized protein [Euphorbia lathyris]|uniref:uncharacterized protein isoform X4 n=1 Tax=Euphorbia lathyris TaxID=212925 RepID=UPI0033143F71